MLVSAPVIAPVIFTGFSSGTYIPPSLPVMLILPLRFNAPLPKHIIPYFSSLASLPPEILTLQAEVEP
jgi:hypothetical protein